MGYEKQNAATVTGRVPDFGAIFMANIETKKECFQRKLFGLPSAQSNFVKQVKEGMVLFLFEYERRELFGVFRATSDGEINIVPNAFKSTGNQFPAQVHFTPIWHCSPLSEHEFEDAIRDNYFSRKKFHFGLSEDQVRDLLMLFLTKRIKKKLPKSRFTRDVDNRVGYDRRIGDDRNLISDRIGFETHTDIGHGLVFLSEFAGNSRDIVKEVDDHMYLTGDFVENNNKVNYELGPDIETVHSVDLFLKGTQIDNDAGFLTNDVKEDGKFDDDGHSMGGAVMKDERKMYNNLGPIMPAEHTQNSFSEIRRVDNEGRFLMMEKIRNERNIEDGFLPISTEHHEKRSGKLGQANNNGSFLIDNYNSESVDDMVDGLGSVRAADHYEELIRETSTGNPIIEANQSDQLWHFSPFHGSEKPYIPDHSYSASPNSIVTGVVPCEPEDPDIRPRFFSYDSDEPYISDRSYPTSHDAILTRMNPNEAEDDIRPRFLSYGSDKPYISDHSYSTSHDAILTRVNPCEPEKPYSSDRSLSVVSHDPIVTRVIPYEPKDTNILFSSSKSELAPYRLEDTSSARYLDEAPGFEDKISSPNKSHLSCYSTRNTFPIGRSSDNRECKTAAQGGLMFSEPFASLDSWKVETTENGIKGSLSIASSSSMNPFFAFDNGYHVGLQGKYLHDVSESFTSKELSSDAGRMHMQYGCSSEARHLFSRKDVIDPDVKYSSPSRENKHSNPNNKRASVFARLTSAPEVCLQEQEIYHDAVNGEYDPDASVDEVMNMLHQRLNYQARATKGDKLMVRQEDENDKLTITSRKMEYELSKVKMEADDTNQIVEGIDGSVLQETRLVDFKRRRKANKNVLGSCKESSVWMVDCKRPVENAEAEGLAGKVLVGVADVESLAGKSCKRRKLVRPVFEQKESTDEGISSDSTANMQSTSHDNLLQEHNTENQQEAVKSCENINMPCNVVELPSTQKTTETTEAEKNQECEQTRNLEIAKRFLNSLEVKMEESNHKTSASL